MKKNLFHKYEYGAHFQYKDLYKELLNLITKFPLERIGLNGIFFQRNINEKPINLPKFKEIKKKNKNNEINNSSKLLNVTFLQKNNFKFFSDFFQKNNSELKISFPSLHSYNNNKNENISFENLSISLKKKVNNKLLNKSKSTDLIFNKNEKIKIKNMSNKNFNFLKNKSKYYQKFFYNEKDYLKRLERAKRKKKEKKQSLSISNIKENDFKKSVLENFFHKLLSKKKEKLY